MANPSTAHEPSMEEILASIRQIISEDGDGASTAGKDAKDAKDAKAVDPAEAEAPPDMEAEAAGARATPSKPEIARDQGGFMKPQMSESPAKASAQPAGHSSFAPTPSASPPKPETPRLPETAPSPVRPHFPAPHSSAPRDDGHLLSERSNAEVSSAFSALTHTILAQNARTLEDLISEMLRPMLKEWLDGNLPPLVERLVKEEIARVSRGRR